MLVGRGQGGAGVGGGAIARDSFLSIRRLHRACHHPDTNTHRSPTCPSKRECSEQGAWLQGLQGICGDGHGVRTYPAVPYSDSPLTCNVPRPCPCPCLVFCVWVHVRLQQEWPGVTRGVCGPPVAAHFQVCVHRVRAAGRGQEWAAGLPRYTAHWLPVSFKLVPCRCSTWRVPTSARLHPQQCIVRVCLFELVLKV